MTQVLTKELKGLVEKYGYDRVVDCLSEANKELQREATDRERRQYESGRLFDFMIEAQEDYFRGKIRQ